MRPAISLIVLMFSILPALEAREIHLKDAAPGLMQELENTIRNAAPKLQQNIGGQEHGLKREIKFSELSFDSMSGVAKLKGSIRYFTSDAAVINQLGLGVSATFKLDTAYDVKNNTFTKLKVSITIGNGWGSGTLDLKVIKKVLDGDLVAALDLIPNGGIVKRKSESEYDARKLEFEEKYGEGNVYFASSDFVRWAGPATAGKWAVALASSGGGAAPALKKEAISKAKDELVHVTAWLKSVGVGSAKDAATDLLTGKPISLPKLKLVWQKVKYSSQVIIGGKELPPIKVHHIAFVLIWEKGNSPPIESFTTDAELDDDNSPRLKWGLGIRYAMGSSGCRIIFLSEGGPAEKSGIQLEDLITQVDGQSVKAQQGDSDPLLDAIKNARSQSIEFRLLRDGTQKTLQVTLEPKLD